MTTARSDILATIRHRLGRGVAPEAGRLIAALDTPRRGPQPARAHGSQADLVGLFEAMAVEMAATVTRIHDAQAVPAAAAGYLAENGLPWSLRIAPGLRDLPWDQASGLTVGFGAATPEDAASLTPAFAGIAETGSLALLSGPDSPTSLNFLPDTHMVMLSAADVVAVYEDVWDRLRRDQRQGGRPLPRSINLITGPSRTGDIEQTIQLGAHGPRRLHILLIDAQRE